MRYAIIVLALLGVLVSPRPAAAAGFFSGNQLLAGCKASELACTMYVTGWRDAFHTAMLFITAATCEKQ